MAWASDLWVATQDFLELGGWVLVALLAVTFVMWTLILERWQYLRTRFPVDAAAARAEWEARAERSSWHAQQIRRELVSRAGQRLRRFMPAIKTLVALCPLLGLLGTVTGMIEVFEVMAFAGGANPRAMAHGVSRATIPTMAGMVAALSGLVVAAQLERRLDMEAARVADTLSPEA